MDTKTSTVFYLPTELLESILQYLPILELMRCRRVCRGWRDAADSLTSRDECWKLHCARDHSSTYEQARIKCSPDLSWRQLYQSLHLWTKLDTVKKTNWTEICRYHLENIGVCDINALMGDIIVQEDSKILYYNLDGELTGSFDVNGEQLSYTETENLIVYVVATRTHGFQTEMRIIKKINGQPDVDGKIVVPEVFSFIVMGQDIYYVPWLMDKALVCTSKSQNEYKTTILHTFDCEVMSLGGINGNIYVYLENGETYQRIDDKFVNITDTSLSILEITMKYNLTSYQDEILRGISKQIGRKIYGYRFYGNIAIFECLGGVIRIYYCTELINSPRKCRPLLEFNLREKLNLKRNKKSSYFRSVAGVDVIEKEDGHIILASLPYGAFAIELVH